MASNSITRGKELTQEFLKECLHYDPETGVFTWLHRPLSHFKSKTAYKIWNKRFSNKTAGGIDERGYMEIGFYSYQHRAHRLVWLYVYGSFPETGIDHINGDFKDNRLCNLREADQFGNMQNFRNAMKNNSCGILGVSQKGNRFIARIQKDWKSIYLGTFKTSDEARDAYLKAKRELHPFGTI